MIGKLFAGFKKEETQTEADALPRAFAAMLIEAARADEDYTEEERRLIDRTLAAKFSLTSEEAGALRTQAEADQAASNDLYKFTSVLKDGLDRDGKIALIEDLWRVVLSDEERDPHEEMVIRRLVGLIHLEDTDSHRARQRVEAGEAGEA